MKYALLTNQARASRRPPFLFHPVGADVLVRLFPEVAKHRAPSRPLPQKKTTNSPQLPIPMEVFTSTQAKPAGLSSPNGRKSSPPVIRHRPAWPSVARDHERAPFRDPPSIPTSKDGVEGLGDRLPLDAPENHSQPPEPPKKPAPVTGARQRDFASPPDRLRATRSALELQRLLERHPDIPDQSILLGVCKDGLPVVVDLYDSGPGAMLVMSDERENQIELLHNAIDSAASRNSPRLLQFLVISHQPQNWHKWVKERGFGRHCLTVAGADEDSVREWVLRLADWTEQRRLGQISGPPVLLVMDTLSFLPRLAYDVRLNFDWMAKEGPSAQVWPLAAISTDLAASLGVHMLCGFQSRILGYSKSPHIYSNLFSLTDTEISCLGEQRQYSIQVGERWIHLHLPG